MPVLLVRLGAFYNISVVRPKPQSFVPEVPCNVSNQKPTSRQAAKAVEAARKASDGQPDAETKEVTIWGFLETLGALLPPRV